MEGMGFGAEELASRGVGARMLGLSRLRVARAHPPLSARSFRSKPEFLRVLSRIHSGFIARVQNGAHP